MRKNILIIILNTIIFSLLLFGCANQLPPTGGEDDTTPPMVKKIVPAPNSLNYSERTVSIEFDKYIDRRSFREALFISPKPSGELNYNWSGTKVEIEFPKNLLKNTTYTFVIGKGMKDIRNNYLKAPIQFAFSTGAVIDNGKIRGKVFTQKSLNVIIFAYINKDISDSLMNPHNKFPDFFTQVNENNQFYFNHLPPGKFRLFAIKDNNKNLLYDIGEDEVTVLNSDIIILDTTKEYNADFIFSDFMPDENLIVSDKLIPMLVPDTSGSIYSSVKINDNNIPVDSRFVFYFKGNKLSRFDIAENIKLIDTVEKKEFRMHLNWSSDSILEAVPTEVMKYSAVMKFIFDLKNTKLKYYYEIIFNVADERKSGNLSGKITDLKFPENPVYVKIFNQTNKLVYYTKLLEDDSVFIFKRIPEGEYLLFSYIDENKNRNFDYGSPFPFKPAERFFVFEPNLNLKGGWNVENVFIKF